MRTRSVHERSSCTINCGSSSIKYEVFNAPDFVMLASGLVEKIGSGEGRLRQKRRNADGTFEEKVLSKRVADHREGFELMANVNREDKIIKDDSELLGIGHRVVHGGELFQRADPDRRRRLLTLSAALYLWLRSTILPISSA